MVWSWSRVARPTTSKPDHRVLYRTDLCRPLAIDQDLTYILTVYASLCSVVYRRHLGPGAPQTVSDTPLQGACSGCLWESGSCFGPY